MSKQKVNSRFVTAAGLALVIGLSVGILGCKKNRMTTGGDSPVTVERLTAAKLTDIKHDLAWNFGATTVLIENQDQPIPGYLTETLFGEELDCKKIEADWKFNDPTKAIWLSNIKVDGEKRDGKVNLPVQPAGHIRVNFGGRQYNIAPGKSNTP